MEIIFDLLGYCYEGNVCMAAILFSKTGFENMMEVVYIYPEFVFSLMFKVLESIEIMPTNSVQIK